MLTLKQATDTPVIAKTRELCQAMLNQESFQRLKSQMDAFMADEDTQAQYQALGDLQAELVAKKRSGMPLTEDEISGFEASRDALMANPVASGFLQVQEEMNKLQDTIITYVQKTFEMNRVPTSDEVDAEMNKGGCCGGGGGCGGGGCGC